MRSLLRGIGGTLVAPVETFRQLADAPRAWLTLLVVILAHLTVPLALAGRLDTRQVVLQELGPKVAETTDRELNESIEQKAKLTEAALVAHAVTGPALFALALTVVLWLWGRFLRTTPAFGVLFSLVAHAELPLAIRSLCRAAVCLPRAGIEPGEIDGLLTSGLGPLMHLGSPWQQALGGADLFLAWTAVLLGVALHVAGNMPPRRAAVGMALAYAAFVAVFMIGLPGLKGA